jgi:alkaline phosphatase
MICNWNYARFGLSALAFSCVTGIAVAQEATEGAATQEATESADAEKPNILVIWGDDIGQSNISAYTMGLMGYQTPNIDRIADEGMIFTD